MRAVVLLFLLLWGQPRLAIAGYVIEGQLQLTGDWSDRIYLSAIASFEDMHAVSDDFIINIASLSSDGRFRLEGDNIPAQAALYRLHVVKKDDPASTIIIGGREENHIHLILDNNSQLKLQTAKNAFLFSDYTIQASEENSLLDSLHSIIAYWTNPELLNTQVSRQYNEQRLRAALRLFAEECAFLLPSLLAIHYLDPTSDYATQAAFYDRILDKWKDQYGTSSYVMELEQQLQFLRFQQSGVRAAKSGWKAVAIPGLLFIILLGVVFLAWRYHQNAKGQTDPVPPEQLLSSQEHRVFALLQEGHSNKEISSALNIEVSTVKSHVHRIYNKLGVRSRKEVLQKNK